MSAEIGSNKPKFQTLCFTSMDDFKMASVLKHNKYGRTMFAVHLQAGLLVMLKERYASETSSLDSVLKEAQVLLDLGPHRNILTILGYARVGTSALVAFEHLQHGDLLKQMHRYRAVMKRFSEMYIWTMLLDISSALEHIHSKDYIFRNVGLSNIFIREVDYTNTHALRFELIEPNGKTRQANIQFVLAEFEACRKVPVAVCDTSKLASGQVIPSDYNSDYGSTIDDDIEYTPEVEHVLPNPSAIMRPDGCYYSNPTVAFLKAVQDRFYYDTDASAGDPPQAQRKVFSSSEQTIYSENKLIPYSARAPNKNMKIKSEYDDIVNHFSESSVMNQDVREDMRALSRSGSRCGSQYGSRNTSRNTSRNASRSASRNVSRSVSRSSSPFLPIPRNNVAPANPAITIPIRAISNTTASSAAGGTTAVSESLLAGSYIKSASPAFRRGITDISEINKQTSLTVIQSSSPRGRTGSVSGRSSVSARSQNSLDHGKFDYVQNMARFAKLDPFEQAMRNHKIRKELEKRKRQLNISTSVDIAVAAAATNMSEDDGVYKQSRRALGLFGTQSVAQATASRPATASMVGRTRGTRAVSPLRRNLCQSGKSSRSGSTMQLVPPMDEEEQLRHLEMLWQKEEIACNPNNPNYPTKLSTTLDLCSPRARDALPSYIDGKQEGYTTFREKTYKMISPNGDRVLTVLGTPNHMPREMSEGKHTLLADIYALGVSALELMCLNSYDQIELKEVQRELKKNYSKGLQTLILSMLGPPDSRPTAEEVSAISMRAVKEQSADYGKNTTLTLEEVIYDRGCKMIPDLEQPLYFDLETTHQKEYLRQRSPYEPTYRLPDDIADFVTPHILAQPSTKAVLAGMRYVPPQVCSLKDKASSIEFNNEKRTKDYVELPLHRAGFKRTKMSEYLEQLNKHKPPLYEHSTATSRKVLDPPEKWMPNASSVLSEFGPEAQLKRIQSEPTPDLLEVLDAGVYSIPNARGGKHITSKDVQSSIHARSAVSAPLKRHRANTVNANLSGSIAKRESVVKKSARPHVHVAFGAVTTVLK